MSNKIAQLAEHSLSKVEFPDLGGNGTLPAYCDECNGKLDFVKLEDKTVLKCRECGAVVELESK